MTRAEMEVRRLKAIPLIQAWKSPGAIAACLDVSRTTLYRWKHALAAGKDLKRKRAPGRPARMTPAEMLKAIAIFNRGPASAKKWTQKRFAQAIAIELGIQFHPDHAGRIMHRLNLIPTKERRK